MVLNGSQRDEYGDGNPNDGTPTKDSGDDSRQYSEDPVLIGPTASSDDASLELSTGRGLFSGGLCFILDDGGNYVLDEHGSPARMKKWEPINSCQRERYTRLHLSTKGPTATCKWLPSVLVSPDHLGVPAAKVAHNREPGRTKSFDSGCSLAGGAGGLAHFGGSVAGSQFQHGRDFEVEASNHIMLRNTGQGLRKRRENLDGFMLMDACRCELPDEGLRADVSGQGLVGVIQDDMKYFVRLHVVDAGDNRLAFESFAGLPQLKELFLPCNNIRNIRLEKSTYLELLYLDLSYNNLSADALSALSQLPNLLDLDLTCNGLTSIPPAMGNLVRLQKLSLERNQLESEKVFEVLSKLPVLRELNLAFNYFTAVRYTPDLAEVSFGLLEDLDLGFNYIDNEAAIEGLALLERLQRIILYGNPLAGPTGEDPSGVCVEGFIDKAERTRRGWARTPIEVITEMPRKRPSNGAGWHRRPYNDIGLAMIDEKHLPPASVFRAAGNKSLFRFESCASSDVSGVEALPRAAQKCSRRKQREQGTSRSRRHDSVFLTSLGRQDGEGDDWFFGEEGDCARDFGVIGDNPGSVFTQRLRRPLDPVVHDNPVKLKMAMTALRYTLRHPVTSSLDVTCQGHGVTGSPGRKTNRGFTRGTAAARARQLPRRPYELRKSRRGICTGSFDESHMDSDLDKVEKVLVSMGEPTIGTSPEKQPPEDYRPPRRPGLSSIIRVVNEVLDESEY